MGDKSARLRETLARLPVKEALALARAVELARAAGQEAVPTDEILAGLRPTLRRAQAPRAPNLRRLIVQGFEPFLTDRDDEPRVAGTILRATIVPWWRAVTHLAGGEVAALEHKLAALLPNGSRAALDDLARTAWEAAAGWTRALVAELAKPKPDAAVRPLFPRPPLVADVTMMAKILALAEPLGAALAAIERALLSFDRLDGRRILDFIPEAVTAAKQHYVALSDSHGMDSAYLALAVLNRLDRPEQILRLGRALSWKPNDSLLRDTEFGVVGDRLIGDLGHAVRDIAVLAARRDGPPDLATLGAAIARYMDEVESLLGEFGFRRDSAWGEAILESRAGLAAAVNRDWLGKIAIVAIVDRVLPVKRRSGQARGLSPEPELVAPPEAATTDALAAAGFLHMLTLRGARHGLGQVREAIEALDEEIGRRADILLEAARQAPGHEAIEAQLAAAAQVLAVLFDDGRGDLLARRLRVAGPVTA